MSKKPKQFYVYILRDPRPGKDMQPFYVGKGTGQRARYHFRKVAVHYNPFLRNLLGRILKAKLKPVIEVVRYYDEEAEAFRLEVDLIALYGRRDLGLGTLCNFTDGGEGAAGRVLRPEEITARNKHWRKLHADPEFAKVRDERIRAVNADPVFAKAAADRFRMLNANPNFVREQRKRIQKLHADPEFAKAVLDNINRVNSDPILVKAKTERLRNLHADPEWSAVQAKKASKRLSRLHTNPEYAKAHAKRSSEAMRKRMADPEYRAKVNAAITAAAARRRAAKAAQTGSAGSTPANDNLVKALVA